MANTYKAVLRGNRLEWSEQVPERLTEDRPVSVQVTVLEGEANTGQGHRMADALEKLARLNALADIPDPTAWEREQRQDRQLPGRDS
ncbi:MAG: hypothetical protein ACRD3T_22695 [Terriglobia bacterium]